MQKEFNKKGQDLSIGTLILIVLGIIVLVLLILGFSLGWGNLWSRINIFGGGASINDVVTACQLAVTSNNVYDYCQNFREIKVNGQKEYINCLDSRVAASLSTKLQCGEGKAEETTAKEYCDANINTLLKTDEEKVKINGDDYQRTKTPPANTYNCTKVSATTEPSPPSP